MFTGNAFVLIVYKIRDHEFVWRLILAQLLPFHELNNFNCVLFDGVFKTWSGQLVLGYVDTAINGIKVSKIIRRIKYGMWSLETCSYYVMNSIGLWNSKPQNCNFKDSADIYYEITPSTSIYLRWFALLWLGLLKISYIEIFNLEVVL